MCTKEGEESPCLSPFAHSCRITNEETSTGAIGKEGGVSLTLKRRGGGRGGGQLAEEEQNMGKGKGWRGGAVSGGGMCCQMVGWPEERGTVDIQLHSEMAFV